MILFLVGNKQDQEERQVTFEEGQRFQESHPIVTAFSEVSAKSNYQLSEVFKQITTQLLEQADELNQSYVMPIEKYQLKST